MAIYMRQKYPDLEIEYYTCDTGKELDETYALIDNLEGYLGKKIIKLKAAEESHIDPFDHFHKIYGGYLPSSNARWCTKKLKLEPFENFVGNDPVISYVGIRGDEDREGYISKKINIQSIFPFRKNIWCEDVVNKFLKNENIEALIELYTFFEKNSGQESRDNQTTRIFELIKQPISAKFNLQQKLNLLLDLNTSIFNKAVFEWIKTTGYPLSKEACFALVDNEDVLVRDDIFRLLRESGVGVPAYYEKLPFEINGKKGEYARSRSGCYFCFFQQKIEWVWLYEQHPERFRQAMDYEKDGYTWNQDETLAELIQPRRMNQIKEDYIKKQQKNAQAKSPFLLESLFDAESEGCAACFI